MPICKKCGENVSNVYDCEHTNFDKYCTECYKEIHYDITEKDRIE